MGEFLIFYCEKCKQTEFISVELNKKLLWNVFFSMHNNGLKCIYIDTQFFKEKMLTDLFNNEKILKQFLDSEIYEKLKKRMIVDRI